MPYYATEGAAGFDLIAVLDEPLTLAPGSRARIPTGLTIELPPGHEGQVRPRSGLAYKHGIMVVNSPGTVDEDFRGEVGVLLINAGQEPFVVSDGDRVAQMVVAPVTRATLVDSDALSSTLRGSGAYGSTGLNHNVQ